MMMPSTTRLPRAALRGRSRSCARTALTSTLVGALCVLACLVNEGWPGPLYHNTLFKTSHLAASVTAWVQTTSEVRLWRQRWST